MVGEAGWDKSYPSLSALKADIQRYKDTLAASQGGNWWKRQHALLVAGAIRAIAKLKLRLRRSNSQAIRRAKSGKHMKSSSYFRQHRRLT